MSNFNLLYYANETNKNNYKHLKNIIIKIISCYHIDEENRFWIQIYYSNDNTKDNKFILMQNPSNDNNINNNNTFTKLIKKFKDYDLYSLIIINLFSIIELRINKDNYPFNNLNLDIINEKIKITKSKYFIFGCGQHLIKKISQCKKKFIDQYEKIITIIQNNVIRNELRTFHFGNMVVNNLLPKHPSIGNLNITELDLNLLSNNLLLLKK
jgi:hypothetical protein